MSGQKEKRIQYTSIEEVLSINVEDAAWLDVCNSKRSALEFVDAKEFADYIAVKADQDARQPKCDFCDQPALFDGKTGMGPWANMCRVHMNAYGVGLGLGKGQRLPYEDEVQYSTDIRNYLDEEFNAQELISKTPEEQLAMINVSALTDYFVDENEAYCQDNELCPECRSHLKRVHGDSVEYFGTPTNLPDEFECPNGCI